jgi:hypothetical protein
MALQTAVVGARHTGQQITWTRTDGTAQNLSGATLTGTIKDVTTGVVTSIAGALSIVTAASGIFSWAYAAGDVDAAGEFEVQFKADYGGGLYDLSFAEPWLVVAAQ